MQVYFQKINSKEKADDDIHTKLHVYISKWGTEKTNVPAPMEEIMGGSEELVVLGIDVEYVFALGFSDIDCCCACCCCCMYACCCWACCC